ncbi:MAG TPA: DUF2085 domain-containing protein [Candidatus Onthocola gallistercoris]|uniref:DUF2085 domain-containing protein n=1 Tax=Candidatus Onthocola gallistercoris TaxID=2840876 RepID=A0A9D1HEZ8_9FIRM|nr:DUF2085 domain-containing protein [Candidatus Onthocola gallistercoris]
MSKLRIQLVRLMDWIGEGSGCHRIPERSFFFHGHQFPVCARCTGVAVGQILAIILNLFRKISFSISLLFLGIMGIDWGIQEIGIKESTNKRRFVTGILGGFGCFNIYCILIRKICAWMRSQL